MESTTVTSQNYNIMTIERASKINRTVSQFFKLDFSKLLFFFKVLYFHHGVEICIRCPLCSAYGGVSTQNIWMIAFQHFGRWCMDEGVCSFGEWGVAKTNGIVL